MNKYAEIIALQSEIINDSERGYKYEQIIRELLPWDRKPPIAFSLSSEQLDGIFIWKGQAYLIECKAKKDKITPGSRDWEDFELKIRRRKNNVIGLFCSLFPINGQIYERARSLNVEGYLVIVLDGSFWEDIHKNNLPIENLLLYMNFFIRINNHSKPPEIRKIIEWCYDKDVTQKKIFDLCTKNSAIFFRRYKSPFHANLYVTREIDNQIETYAKNLKPSVLEKDKKDKKDKENYKQLCIIRDYSGSGKTTLSLEIASNQNIYFGTGVTANEQEIDVKFANFFTRLGDHYGLHEIKTLNKPIVFVIDSLDEASFDLYKKKKEIKSIFTFIENELNKTAEEFNLFVFPLLVIYTIREDYWRDWESEFEGRKDKNHINKRISTFTSEEFPRALSKYSQCYAYTMTNNISIEAQQVLSIPINLLIFSETYQYQGDIEIGEIWEGKVIDSYFSRKKDDIYKRYIQGFNSNVFFQLISLLAFHVVKKKRDSIQSSDFASIINNYFSILSPYIDEIIIALVSELILVKDSENVNLLRFRHSRFIEFLLAFYIVDYINKNDNIKELDNFAQTSFESGVVSMFRIHDYIRYIGKTKFQRILVQIEDYYSKSNLFMSSKLLQLRLALSSNYKTTNEDISLILKNINSSNSKLIINAFYIIVARNNNQSRETVLNLFALSFKSTTDYGERYKLIAKLEYHNLLLHETVLSCLLSSNLGKDWEVYLGLILKNKLYKEFQELWNQSEGQEKINDIIKKTGDEDWKQVNKLLKALMENSDIILGDFNF
jgi:hypothetical protein